MKKKLISLAIIIGAIILDQATKIAILYKLTQYIPLYGYYNDILATGDGIRMYSVIDNIFAITMTWNTGTAFSLFRGLGAMMPIIITLLTGGVICYLLYYLFRHARSYEWVGLSLIIGGALGNLIDRIRFGAVVDFLDFYIIRWPVFNIADVCICLGVGLWVFNGWRAHCRDKKIKDGK